MLIGAILKVGSSICHFVTKIIHNINTFKISLNSYLFSIKMSFSESRIATQSSKWKLGHGRSEKILCNKKNWN